MLLCDIRCLMNEAAPMVKIFTQIIIVNAKMSLYILLFLPRLRSGKTIMKVAYVSPEGFVYFLPLIKIGPVNFEFILQTKQFFSLYNISVD